MIKFPKSLAQHLRSSQTSKCKSLFISSTPPVLSNDEEIRTTYQLLIQHQIEKTKFQIGMQHNIPIIQSNITSAFPTQETISSTVDLAKRSGATGRIFGVGSRGAIDLAKAVTMALNYDNSRENNGVTRRNTAVDGANTGCSPVVQELVLIPKTLGATLASTMLDPLIYHVNEQGLCPPSGLDNNISFPSLLDSESSSLSTKTIVAPENATLNSDVIFCDGKEDTKNIKQQQQQHMASPPSLEDAAFAVLAFCVDTAMALNGTDELDGALPLLNSAIGNALSSLENLNGGAEMDQILDVRLLEKQKCITSALLQTGELLNVCANKPRERKRRNIPLAVASALIPPYYPRVNLLTFVATLYPALCQTYSAFMDSSQSLQLKHNNGMDVLLDINPSLHSTLKSSTISSLSPSLASKMETRTQPDLQAMLETIDRNLFLWESFVDEDSEILKKILHRSLSR